ncbi:GNAT family N-acetyltransferase [Spelaeicoccus albus]|uniref:Ribosomal protein S18 acetylase RimI-like enzyme n=2 Tax=Spelaeicoccus albus TaxID=1280376 RepID=A0A7Z0A9V3_9MICO|nr:GNAT family N-acetyltransferase [Spelaeicoccus albus]NYI66020.1 ribosomal protein S18 acetylase RimI-like enzyme [Spelaeicoccus albus]
MPVPNIRVLKSLSDTDIEAVSQLLPQLSRSAIFDRNRLEAIIEHDATELIVASIDDEIVGMATLVTFPLPTGLRGHVEDVVVDADHRGSGIARLLLETMTKAARERGLRTLDLTTRPSRESALRVYESMGFERRETNALRYTTAEAPR